jgi:uncharacterized OB-fold protein
MTMSHETAATRELLKQKLGCTDADLVKPVPAPTAWSKPFWEAARRRELVLKRCKKCGHVDHPPYLFCTECGSEESEWKKASGTATLYAFAVNAYGVPFPFVPDLPYVTALVDLPEGPRMISNVVGCSPAELRNGMQLEVVFEEASGDVVLPKWRPASQGGARR